MFPPARHEKGFKRHLPFWTVPLTILSSSKLNSWAFDNPSEYEWFISDRGGSFDATNTIAVRDDVRSVNIHSTPHAIDFQLLR
jgi:hypothetical protein